MFFTCLKLYKVKARKGQDLKTACVCDFECFSCSAHQDGDRGGWGWESPTAAGAADGSSKENVHQVDEQCLPQEWGEMGRRNNSKK